MRPGLAETVKREKADALAGFQVVLSNASPADSEQERELERALTAARDAVNGEDLRSAYNILSPLAEAGNTRALNELLELWLNREWPEPFATEVRNDMAPLVRFGAESGNALAQADLGFILFEENPTESLSWLKRAADQGEIIADVGIVSLQERFEIVPDDAFRQSVTRLRASTDVYAKFTLGNMYSRGEVIPRNEREAENNFLSAINSKDERFQAISADYLGRLYASPESVLFSEERALEMYRSIVERDQCASASQVVLGDGSTECWASIEIRRLEESLQCSRAFGDRRASEVLRQFACDQPRAISLYAAEQEVRFTPDEVHVANGQLIAIDRYENEIKQAARERMKKGYSGLQDMFTVTGEADHRGSVTCVLGLEQSDRIRVSEETVVHARLRDLRGSDIVFFCR